MLPRFWSTNRDSVLVMDGNTSGPMGQLERARLDILHLKLEESEDLWHAVDSSLRISATTLEVARVGVWFMTRDKSALYRARIHEPSRTTPLDDAVLPLGHWTAYRDAIIQRRVVAADDARTDPRTAGLCEAYLEPFGIASLLDAPLFLTGDVWGILCHEHTGEKRTWSCREIDFAISVADMLGALLEQSMRLGAERRLRHLEAQEAQARHTNALVRTAAGIAHDTNTVLHAISSNAALAQHATDVPARNEALQAIVEDCQRSARILNQLQELSPRPEVFGDPLRLVTVIDGLRPTLEALAGPTRSLAFDAEEDALVDATRTDVERILMNLVTNAVDATRPDGRIAIRVRSAGSTTFLEVEDDGVGLDVKEATEIFEPYVTTKRERHAGLGLFVVQAISARSHGTVSVTSEPGHGAIFRVSWG